MSATGHGGHTGGIVLRRADGTPMTRKEVILMRRGYFHMLPVLCSNDLVHGSWWMVWGSLVSAIFAIVPLVKDFENFTGKSDVLPTVDFDLTWSLLIFSGIVFAFGSYAFVRAFEEPPKRPLFYYYKHFQTDELLGAWLFLVGTVPAIPYCLVYLLIKPTAVYFFMLMGAILFVAATLLFVLACYPSEKKHKNGVLPAFTRLLGARIWIIKHLANDWLAGTWFLFWANAAVTFGSFVLLLGALGLNAGSAQIFAWLTGFISSGMFLVGSAYFVAGSYPHAQQFYYAIGRGQLEQEKEYTRVNSVAQDLENGQAGGSADGIKKDNGLSEHDVISPLHMQTTLSSSSSGAAAVIAGTVGTAGVVGTTTNTSNISMSSSAAKGSNASLVSMNNGTGSKGVNMTTNKSTSNFSTSQSSASLAGGNTTNSNGMNDTNQYVTQSLLADDEDENREDDDDDIEDKNPLLVLSPLHHNKGGHGTHHKRKSKFPSPVQGSSTTATTASTTTNTSSSNTGAGTSASGGTTDLSTSTSSQQIVGSSTTGSNLMQTPTDKSSGATSEGYVMNTPMIESYLSPVSNTYDVTSLSSSSIQETHVTPQKTVTSTTQTKPPTQATTAGTTTTTTSIPTSTQVDRKKSDSHTDVTFDEPLPTLEDGVFY